MHSPLHIHTLVCTPICNREEKSLHHVTMVTKFLDLNKPWSCKYCSKENKENEKIDRTFLCMIAPRNKMVAHTFLPPFNNANSHVCEQRLLRFKNFATMVTWCQTSPRYYLHVSQLLSCEHPTIMDAPIKWTASKSQAKINNYWHLTEINSRYYGLSLIRTPTRGPDSVCYNGSWPYTVQVLWELLIKRTSSLLSSSSS